MTDLSTPINQAFILGAGLGTRLRPLTEDLPKPLVPVWNAPLITYAFDHLIHDAGTSDFMINTHHAAGKYPELFPDGIYRGRRLQFRHEETLLDTAGGLHNIRDWLPNNEPFMVYNGDILTDLPLRPAIDIHLQSGDLVTLILRSGGKNANVTWDPDTGRVIDIRNALGTNRSNRYQFTGIYLVSPGFLNYLTPGKIETVVVPFLEAIKDDYLIGGILIDDGHWSDLGDRESYLGALKLLDEPSFPSYGLQADKVRVHPTASISPMANIDSLSSIGPDTSIASDTRVVESVIWGNVTIPAGSEIVRSIVHE